MMLQRCTHYDGDTNTIQRQALENIEEICRFTQLLIFLYAKHSELNIELPLSDGLLTEKIYNHRCTQCVIV